MSVLKKNSKTLVLKVEYNECSDIRDIHFTFLLPCIVIDFFLNNQTDALIIQFHSVIYLYMFRASFLPIISSLLLYIRH